MGFIEIRADICGVLFLQCLKIKHKMLFINSFAAEARKNFYNSVRSTTSVFVWCLVFFWLFVCFWFLFCFNKKTKSFLKVIFETKSGQEKEN